MRIFAGPDELLAAAGTPLGASGYRRIEQRHIDAFAELTGDRQWIHVDRDRAAAGPFGAPIAHGLFTLSLVIPLLDEVFRVDGMDLVLNKGLDRVRFTGPVPAGAEVRLAAELAEVTPRARGYTEAAVSVELRVAGADQPACTAVVRYLYHAGTGSRAAS